MYHLFPFCTMKIEKRFLHHAAEHHTYYYNRKGYYAIVLQGLVNHWYCFIDVYTGWPGE